MNSSSIHQPNLDIIALEIKHQSDFERSEAMPLGLSLFEQEFSKNYRDEPRILFEDGKYDGELDLEPEPYQWFNPIYRKGSNKIGQSRTVSTIPGFESAKLLVEKEKKTRFYL